VFGLSPLQQAVERFAAERACGNAVCWPPGGSTGFAVPAHVSANDAQAVAAAKGHRDCDAKVSAVQRAVRSGDLHLADAFHRAQVVRPSSAPPALGLAHRREGGGLLLTALGCPFADADLAAVAIQQIAQLGTSKFRKVDAASASVRPSASNADAYPMALM
jgi:hypothetical protein